MCNDVNDKICPRQKFFGVKNCRGHQQILILKTLGQPMIKRTLIDIVWLTWLLSRMIMI